jgi:hypothetical protein
MAVETFLLQVMDFWKSYSPIVALWAGYVICDDTLVNDSTIAYGFIQLEREKVSLRKSTEPFKLTNC